MNRTIYFGSRRSDPREPPLGELVVKAGTGIQPVRVNHGRVRRDTRSLADQRGWRLIRTGPEGQQWEGPIKARGLTYGGRALVHRGKARFFVKSLPSHMSYHPKYPCFVRKFAKGKFFNNYYEVHHHHAASLSDLLVAVETIFVEVRSGNFRKSSGLFDLFFG